MKLAGSTNLRKCRLHLGICKSKRAPDVNVWTQDGKTEYCIVSYKIAYYPFTRSAGSSFSSGPTRQTVSRKPVDSGYRARRHFCRSRLTNEHQQLTASQTRWCQAKVPCCFYEQVPFPSQLCWWDIMSTMFTRRLYSRHCICGWWVCGVMGWNPL